MIDRRAHNTRCLPAHRAFVEWSGPPVASNRPLLQAVPPVLAAWRAAREPAPSRAVPVGEAVGFVLAQDLAAPGLVPPHAIALRAGYAVASQDLVGVSPYAPLILQGRPPLVGEGERLPPGTDAVLPFDAVATSGPAVEIVLEVRPGENVRRAGEDVASGEVLRRAGQVLRPLDAALARAAGIGDACVRRFELVLAGERDNLALLEALAAHFRSGMRAVVVPFDPADAEDTERELRFSTADLILVAAAPTPSLCAILHPGPPEPVALALGGAETALVWAGRAPVVLAPPRLDALIPLMACVIEPYAAFLTGREPRRVWRRARLARKIVSAVGVTELRLVRETMGGLEPLGAGSITLASLAAAEGFLVVPPDSEGFADGATVEAYEL